MKLRHAAIGFSLIELVIFIVITGVASVTLLKTFQTILQHSPSAHYQTTAISLAQERMDLILGQQQMKGFSSFTDPCGGASPPSICTPLSGYTVSSNIAASAVGTDNNYKTITVTTDGPANSKAILTMQVGS